MSLDSLMVLFGKPKEVHKPAPQTTIHQNKQTIIHHQERVGVLEQLIKNELIKASTHKKGGKIGQAIICMRKKKMYEKSIMILENQIMTLETLMFSMESNMDTKTYVDAIKNTNSVLGELTTQINVEDTEEVIDDLAENIEESNRITELVSKPLDIEGVSDMSDNELLGELDKMDKIKNEEEDIKQDNTWLELKELNLSESIQSKNTVTPYNNNNRIQQQQQQQKKKDDFDSIGELVSF